jgi:hypothetical protein
MTSVTIGPGVMTRTAVIARKAANSSQFMTTYALRVRHHCRRKPMIRQ